jgi:hypothetical protein
MKWLAVGSGIAAGTIWIVNGIHAAAMKLEAAPRRRGGRNALLLLPYSSPAGAGLAASLTF